MDTDYDILEIGLSETGEMRAVKKKIRNGEEMPDVIEIAKLDARYFNFKLIAVKNSHFIFINPHDLSKQKPKEETEKIFSLFKQ